jgi:hypothetical protein
MRSYHVHALGMFIECGLVGESALATVEFMGCTPGKGTSHKEKDIGKTGEHREGNSIEPRRHSAEATYCMCLNGL